MSLINQFVEYLLSQEKTPSRATVKNYRADIGQFVRWYEAKYQNSFDPKSITFKTIEEYKQNRIENKESGIKDHDSSFVIHDSAISVRSAERHLSSLRKFFTFLKLEGHIPQSPFELATNDQRPTADPYRLKDFKNYLYVYNAAHLTIKNYIIDVRQFLSWAEEVAGLNESWKSEDKNLFSSLDSSLVEEYKNRLIQQEFSPLTVNRKLSSLRKYFGWAAEEKFLPSSKFKVQSSKLPNENPATQGDALRAQMTRVIETQGLPNSKYSSFAPVRLFQKLGKACGLVFDSLVTSPLVGIAKKGQYALWKIKGKPIFERITNNESRIKKKIHNSLFNIHNSSQSNSFPSGISKALYAPLSVSIRNFPWHKKAIYHLRYTRPDWYKKYHSYPITHYFHFAILVIFMSAIGFGFYNAFVSGPKSPALAVLPTAPPRLLSFQGRLTDNSDNPITASTPLRFTIYDDKTASGGALLWQEIYTVSPDSDGIFSILLGTNTAIPSTLFSQNAALYLGVTVQTTSELTPRQQLATVAYAANSETLQGLPPITALGSADAKTNTVLALDSSGNLTISGDANPAPVFQASSGQFTLSGKVLSLTTVAGTNTNVVVTPDGLGNIDLQKPLVNTSNSNNIGSAMGAVEVDDRFAILATSSGQSAFTLNQNGTGDLISASTSGVAKFTVDSSGNTTIAGNGIFSGNIGIGVTSPGSKLQVAGNITPEANGTRDIGSASLYWNNLYVNNIISGGVGLANYWQRLLGVVSPINITDSLNLGATATSSALVHLAGTAGENSWINTGNVGIGNTNPSAKFDITGSASTSANISLRGNATSHTFNVLDNGTLNFQRSAGGDAGLVTSMFIKNDGNIGIGTTSPGATLDVNGIIQLNNELKFTQQNPTIRNNYGTGSDFRFITGAYTMTLDENKLDTSSTQLYLQGISGGTVSIGDADTAGTFNISKGDGTYSIQATGSTGQMTIAGNVGIGTTSPAQRLDVLAGGGATQLRLSSDPAK
ncbi:MAG: hypothetical protein COY68_00490, partial [Candidatus Levybacteria bacterium CG_4_10_14_0_8_um_filter_35_23]